ncbi:MAG: SurA N-terminal domain-containing protein [Spirochaetes bacterium]|nr:SurA N-terminal domain-containing protein [Spirochaetota bacterium]MBP8991270.1 SurA N-terminal domain-containing protein [Spirochaetota bacterium]HOV46029.1 SurA N-terminal domain-containing protein [Exilispira sp.]HPO60146.1 SurA N-terminal domain-containing protein [Exilispira sp.]HQM90096.1 SurA N-terminal domain-containing protein [Exilispira sp.]
MNSNSKKLIAIFIIIFSIILISAEADYIILTVNDQAITYLQFVKTYNLYISQLKQQGVAVSDPVKETIDYMIQDILITQDAEEKGIKVTNEELQNYIDHILKSYSITIDELENQLKMQGMTLTDYMEAQKKQILMYRYIQNVIEPKVKKPTKTQITNFYNENKEKFKGSYQYTTIIIRTVVSQDASFKERLSLKKVMDKLLTILNEDNSKLNKSFIESFALENKVQLVFEESQYYPELEGADLAEALSDLTTGKLSSVVELDNNFYIFMLKQKVKIDYIPLNAVQLKIYNYLLEQRKMELFQTTIDNLKKNAVIVWFVNITSIKLP